MMKLPKNDNWHIAAHISVFIVFSVILWGAFFFVGNIKLIPCDISCQANISPEEVEILENIKFCQLNAWDAMNWEFINNCQTIYTFFPMYKPFYHLAVYNIIIVALVTILIYLAWYKKSKIKK